MTGQSGPIKRPIVFMRLREADEEIDRLRAENAVLRDVAEAAQALHNSPIAHRGPDSPDGRLMVALERLESL